MLLNCVCLLVPTTHFLASSTSTSSQALRFLGGLWPKSLDGPESLLFKFVEMEIGMNKKLMALAVAAAVSVPTLALADDSTVTLYGFLNADLESVQAKGASDVVVGGVTTPGSNLEIKNRTRVSSNSSYIGFRGIEPLSPGFNAWFQVESGVNLDAGGSTWASRNSAVGLNGDFGSILLGQWDSPYKVSTGRFDPFGDSSAASYSAIINNGGGTSGNTGRGFDRRLQNTFQYWTPSWAGFSGRAAYGANEEKPANGSSNPHLWDLALTYQNGPLYVTGAYEEHKDFGTFVAATPQGKDTGLKGGVSYTFANVFTIAGIYEQLKYKSDAAGTELKFKEWYVTGTYKLGPNAFSLAYGQKGKDKLNGNDQDQTEVKQYSFRYGYSFSKRTELWAFYTKLQNESRINRDFATNPITPVAGAATLPLGADPQAIGAGLLHRF
jgi:predicted porin